jgi:DmsE family decaheme c-type cytochrome
MRTLFRVVILFSAVLTVLWCYSSTAQEASPQSGEYAGSDQCLACHEGIQEPLNKTPHGSKAFHEKSDQGCETCHGPGQAHIDAGGDVSLIMNPAKADEKKSAMVCLTCHETSERTHWKGSVHQQRGLACVSCHSIHAFKSEEAQLKTVRVEETCGGCHLDIQSQIQRTSHHPIREGLMTCTDCHNPHGTLAPKLIIANSSNEQCYTCHTEKRGPFLWDHPPVRENCMNCHNPHGSNHEKLLVTSRPWLCQSCHLDTRHPGTLYDSTNLLTSNREFARSCQNCHLQIHGSSHPSGRAFTR